MPILGRAGESLSTRLFGKPGVGQGLKNLASGATTLGGRVVQGLQTPGGFLGAAIKKVTPVASADEGNGYQDPNSDEEKQQLQNGGSSQNVKGLNDIKGSGASQSNIEDQNRKNIISALTGNWDDTSDSIKDTEKYLESFGKSIGTSLGKARDAYLGSAQNKLDKSKEAIEGNRELIAKNQTKDLRNLAEDVRSSIFNTNISLGSAAGSSASLAAAKAISKAAGKNRAETLTGYGDQISKENQNEKNVVEEYNLQRKNIYDWEERNKKQLIAEYEEERDTLRKLKDKVPEWKQKDIEALQDKNLNKLIGGLQSVYSAARGYRDTLSAIITDMYGQSDELANSSIGIDKPAELDTPVFDENMEMPAGGETDENAESFYNPKVKQKKRVGTDILGNPYYIDGEE